MIEQLGLWWAAVSTFEAIFWYIAIPATLVFLIQMALVLFGLGDDADADVDSDVDGDTDISFRFFTIKGLIMFLVGFGWAGIAGVNSGWSSALTLVSAGITGVALMLIIGWVLWVLTRLTSSGNINIKNAAGSLGKVYLTVPHKRTGVGKVQIVIQNSLREYQAMTDFGRKLVPGTPIEVVEVQGNVLIVRKVRQSNKSKDKGK